MALQSAGAVGRLCSAHPLDEPLHCRRALLESREIRKKWRSNANLLKFTWSLSTQWGIP
jgi:hypothetical protein